MKLILCCLLLAGFCTTAYGQRKISPEQQRLEVFAGSWTVEGSEATYLEVCSRIQGNHIQCISASKEKDKTDSSVSYLTYSAPEKVYLYYGMYPSGNSRTLRGNWEKDRFIFEGQRVTAEKTTKWRVTIIPVPKGLQFIEEAAVNDGNYEKKADFVYLRV
jgi:hypothetical protein